ncbi:hypothetical protein TL5120_02821 [Thalassovita autumnalis]|uniref:Uncharacterized protein n=1 Tax=Thalassovita autumnalis TaxID=2072972 RepID=A0A0P1GC24_9RHOB|nr:hypothetical protein [Thalassovita autumnalis]CUH73015.1 hypothetical protein TL5120_02821 [Thalassovita autumnalis]
MTRFSVAKNLRPAALAIAACFGLSACLAANSALAPASVPNLAEADAPEVSRTTPDWLNLHFEISDRSARLPQFSWDQVIFHAKPGDCSKHRDAAGPSDCATRTTRSVIAKNQIWQQELDFKVGQRYLLTFDFWVDPDFIASGSPAKVSLARWYGSRLSQTPLFEVELDARRGVTFLGTTCVSAKDLDGWHRFSVRMRLAEDETGFVEMRCDSALKVGQPLLAKSNIVTTQPWHCAFGAPCRRKYPTPDQFSVELGIIADPVRGRFAPLPAEGLTVRMKRIEVKRLLVIIGRVEDL